MYAKVFNPGDRVECISRNEAIHQNYLTIGKIYVVIESYEGSANCNWVRIKNDNGEFATYFIERFKLVASKKNIDYLQIAKEVTGNV